MTTCRHTYAAPGRYTIAVKVIDIFGNDTMTLVPVTIGSETECPEPLQTNPIDLITLLLDCDTRALQLPDFQRSWVWDEDRIKSLIASVSRRVSRRAR